MASVNGIVPPGQSRVLSSQWGNLSPHLIAKFYPVKRLNAGKEWGRSFGRNEISAADQFVVDDGVEVWAPITDGTSEIQSNWVSPFEGAGAESKAPLFSAMLQSGELVALARAGAPAMEAFGIAPEFVNEMTQDPGSFMNKIVGRTGITKLNSTQVFVGMPPVKMTLTAHFRALVDPVEEVKRPLQQLKEWAVPQLLAEDGVIAGALINGTQRDVIETIYPSKAPQIIAMQYGDMTYSPMVIENLSEPFTNPRSEQGVMLSCSVQMTLATLTALDRCDIQKMYW